MVKNIPTELLLSLPTNTNQDHPKGIGWSRECPPENSDLDSPNIGRRPSTRRCTTRAAVEPGKELCKELVGRPRIRRHDQQLVFVYLKTATAVINIADLS